jgi:DNA-binding Lrp family transcriptional regulator
VLEAHLVTGEYDYLVKVAVAGKEYHERFLRESLFRAYLAFAIPVLRSQCVHSKEQCWTIRCYLRIDDQSG